MLGVLLDIVSRKLETEQRWSAIEAAYERVRTEDPDAWHDYRSELGQLPAGARTQPPKSGRR